MAGKPRDICITYSKGFKSFVDCPGEQGSFLITLGAKHIHNPSGAPLDIAVNWLRFGNDDYLMWVTTLCGNTLFRTTQRGRFGSPNGWFARQIVKRLIEQHYIMPRLWKLNREADSYKVVVSHITKNIWNTRKHEGIWT